MLLAFIDDAAGKIMQAMFSEEETIKDLSISAYDYIKRWSTIGIFVDRGKVYKGQQGQSKYYNAVSLYA